MKKNKEKLHDRLPKTSESLTESGFAGQQSRTISLAHETIPAAVRKQSTKGISSAELIPFPESSCQTRIPIEHLSTIWNDDKVTYNNAELLIIRDWLCDIAGVISEVINSPGFTPPLVSKTDTAMSKTKVICLPSASPQSTSINIPSYKEAKSAS